MARLGLPYSWSQPVWVLAQTEPSGMGTAPLMGRGAMGVPGDLMGDGVLGGDKLGDGVMGQGRLGGLGVMGGGTGWPGALPWSIPTQDPLGDGLMGDGLMGDVRPDPNPWLDSGAMGGFSPADWGDLDPDPQQPGGAARYLIFGGGPCAQADGTTFSYSDRPFVSIVVPILQGGFLVKGAVNTTGTSGLHPLINYTVGIYAVRPVWPGTRRLRVIFQWAASGVGWLDWYGITLPAGAALYQAFADLDDDGCGTAWPTVTGAWPASVAVGGVTSPCPAAGAFTVRS